MSTAWIKSEEAGLVTNKNTLILYTVLNPKDSKQLIWNPIKRKISTVFWSISVHSRLPPPHTHTFYLKY